MFNPALFHDSYRSSDSPYLNHFLQPDTIIPSLASPQSWNRYSYVQNNPIGYSDPTGHVMDPGDGAGGGTCDKKCLNSLKKEDKDKGKDAIRTWRPRPTGNNLELNLLAGITLNAQGYDNGPATVGLYYYSWGVVTDKNGNIQLYTSTKDQVYIPGSSGQMGGYLSGQAEKDLPSSAYGIGVTVSRGLIYGEGFNTDKFLGKGYTEFLGVGPVSGGKFVPHDQHLNYTGYDYGWGVAGGPVSQGSVATDTKPGLLLQLPKELIPVCQMVGQCGSSFPPLMP
jgi:hypothetical protein